MTPATVIYGIDSTGKPVAIKVDSDGRLVITI